MLLKSAFENLSFSPILEDLKSISFYSTLPNYYPGTRMKEISYEF